MHRWEYEKYLRDFVPLTIIYSQVETEMQYYLMFRAFRDNEEAISASLLPAFAQLMPCTAPNPKVWIERIAKCRAAGRKLFEELDNWISKKPLEEQDAAVAEMGTTVEQVTHFYRHLMVEARRMAIVGCQDIQLA